MMKCDRSRGKSMKYTEIGGVKIEKTAALAPMASVADRAYRLMAKEYGAAYVVGEMASCKGLCYNDRKTAELLSEIGRASCRERV